MPLGAFVILTYQVEYELLHIAHVRLGLYLLELGARCRGICLRLNLDWL